MKAMVGSNWVAGRFLKIWMFLKRCWAVCCCACDIETTSSRQMNVSRRMLVSFEEDFSRSGATAQRAAAFLRVFVALKRRCVRNLLLAYPRRCSLKAEL